VTPGATSVARRIAEALEREGVEYAVGGAIACAYWSEPRATKDVDVNLFLDDRELDRVFAVLRAAGCELDEMNARATAVERGDFVARFGEMRVDIFLDSVPYHAEARRRRVRVHDLDGGSAWILSAEATCVFKMMFFRTKDLGDVENVVAKQGPSLDHAHVRAALVEMAGDADPRVRRWDEIVATFGHGRPPRAPFPG
jgi:hypothetical protein